MKLLWRLSKEAIRYRGLYIIAILATLSLTFVNLAAPKVLSSMTGIVERGVDEEGRVTERGTHEELIRLGGSYARMNEIQAAENH